MKLYVLCPRTNKPIYLSFVVERRSQIYESFSITCPYDGQTHVYGREDVKAEPTLGAAVGGAILVGLVGAALAGPLGAILGGGAGLLMGSNAEEEERRRVQRFYQE